MTEPTSRTPPTNATVHELAILGVLADAPMHGYELRKRLTVTLGAVRALSFGSLYPALRRLEHAGQIAVQEPPVDPDAVPLSTKRSRVTYRITAEGKERLSDLLGDTGPQSFTDEGFLLHLAFFPRTEADARIRILEGRRRRVEERREGLRAAMSRAAERLDQYTLQLHELGVEASDREVRWLNELIATEQAGQASRAAAGASAPRSPTNPRGSPRGRPADRRDIRGPAES